jgi:hypothetical protein
MKNNRIKGLFFALLGILPHTGISSGGMVMHREVMQYDPTAPKVPYCLTKKPPKNVDLLIRQMYMNSMTAAVNDLKEAYEAYQCIMNAKHAQRYDTCLAFLDKRRNQCIDQGYQVESLDSIFKKIKYNDDATYPGL